MGWAGIVAGLAATGIGLVAFMFARRARAKTTARVTELEADPIPAQAISSAGPPEGYRRLTQKEVTPAITQWAKKILREHGKEAIGTQVPFELDGVRYLGVVELHYHPPGGPLRPWGPHHGISIFVEQTPATA